MTQIQEPRVRETSDVIGTGNITLTGRMQGSLAVADVMANGDTADFVIEYQNSFEELSCSYNSAGNYLVRGTPFRSRHADGTVDQNHVSFASGQKTVILTFSSGRIKTGIVRYDIAQSPTSGEQAQARANAPPFASTTPLLFPGLATAPVGWTTQTTHNDKALRIVSGTPSSGGSVDFSTCFGRTATDGFTLSQANLPSVNFTLSVSISDPTHPHNVSQHTNGTPIVSRSQDGGGSGINVINFTSGAAVTLLASAASTGISASGTAASGGSASAKTAGMDMRVKYVDSIWATKD